MITFEQAREAFTRETGQATADYGWENDTEFLVVPDYNFPPFDAPDYLVHKETGALREVYGLLGLDPVPGLRPIGNVPA
jgi:hypothetical protein